MFENIWHITNLEDTNTNVINRILESKHDLETSINKLNFENLNDPFLVNEMELAVKLIEKHLENDSKICIHGDYDTDGITSSYILYAYLMELNADVHILIPDRFDDGYGISMENAERIVLNKYDLIITTDCGITAVNEVSYLKSKGVDVLISDHHKVKEILPTADAVLCNTRKDNKYPFPLLSGAGMSLKLIQALTIYLNRGDFKKYISYCAIGTIADVVPLKGENRIIASLGLKYLSKIKTIGLDALMIDAGIKKSSLDSYGVAFIIGPRLNAAGRMGNASISFNLLNAKTVGESKKLAKDLSELNAKRRAVQEKLFLELKNFVLNNQDILKNPVILLPYEGAHKGVLGIVASKMTEFFQKPFFILNSDNDIYEGSGRSIAGFSLIKALDSIKEILVSYGGHDMAAGLQIHKDRLAEASELLKLNFKEDVTFTKNIKIDTICDIEELNYDLVNNLNDLGPFGEGNLKPILAIKNAFVVKKKLLGKNGNHIKFTVKKNNKILEFIAFNSDLYEQLIIPGQAYDFAFNLDINRYKGYTSLQAVLIDIHFEGNYKNSTNQVILKLVSDINKFNKKFNFNNLIKKLYEVGMPRTAAEIKKGRYFKEFNRKDIEYVYKLIKKGDGLSAKILDSDKIIKYCLAVEILFELGIVNIDRNALFSYDNIKINQTGKNRLENSNIFKCLTE